MKKILFLIAILFLISGIALGHELGAGYGTSYPATLDTDASVEVDYPSPCATTARAAVPNDTNAAVIAIETELGINPSGGYDTVKARLDAGGGLYYLKTEIDNQAEVEAIWGVSLVNDGDLDLYYLKTAIDTLSEVETIYSANIIDDTELATALGDYYLKTAIDSLSEVETIYSKNITDSDELAAALGAYYLKTAIDSQGEVETIWGVSLVNDGDLDLYYLKTAINTQAKVETIWGVTLANDSELHSQNTDTDLDPTFEATFVKKADTVNVLSDITSPGANIEDAVTKKHNKNADTDLDPTFEATFVKKADTINVLSDITSPGANIENAVTKRHTSGSETLVGDVSGTVGANTVNKIKGHTVDETAIGNNKILVYKTTGNKYVYEAKPVAGSTTFTGLTDTPSSYTGKAGEILRVNTTPNAVEFSGVGIETTLTVGSNTKIPTSKAVNDFCETNKNYMQELEDDTVPYLGGHLRLNEKSIYMNANLSSDHTYSGLLDYQVVGESVVFGDLLYFNWGDKEWKKADADIPSGMPGLRIAVESATDGQVCNMLVMGYIRDDTWDFTGYLIYASTTAGGVTSTAPSTTGQQLQRVGVAQSADILFFDPSIDVGEI